MKLLFSPGSAAVAGRVRDIVELLGDVRTVVGGADALTDDVSLVVASARDTALINAAREACISVEVVTEVGR